MKKPALLAVAVSIALGFLASPGWAWWPLAHCVLSIEGNSPAGPGYHNSADIFPSWHLNWENTGVTDEFPWTHELQRTATGMLRLILKPTYYGDSSQEQDNSASKHMEILCTSKLQRTNPQPDSWDQTRIGWAAHNREDQAGLFGEKAHFDLFPGPNTPLQAALWLDHRDFEKHCEVLIYIHVCWLAAVGTGDPNDAVAAGFDGNGDPVGLPAPYDVIIDTPTGNVYSDGLICLAMKAFRKKQQTIDTIDLEGLAPRSRSEIMSWRVNTINTSKDGLLNFALSDYNEAWIWWQTDETVSWYWAAAVMAAGGS